MPASLLLALALQTSAQPARVGWVPNPRIANGTWVADPAHHLSPATLAAINSEISALESSTGAEIAVVIVDSTSGLEPFDFALAIHRAWGVGKRGINNGAVFLWVPAQRKIFITVGQGLQGVLPDARVGRIRDGEIFPAFRRNDFDGGMLAGVRALAAAAREEEPVRGVRGAVRGNGVMVPLLGGAGLLASGLGGFVGYRRWRRRRPRMCPNGHGAMRLLDEQADNEKLEGGERLEEKYGSVDYDVWVCDTCKHSLKFGYSKTFTKYKQCPDCKYRTLKETVTTIAAATTLSEGRESVTRACGNCAHHTNYTRYVPRVVPSTSSSGGSSGGGSSSSSFGGGSSDGGGSGGSY